MADREIEILEEGDIFFLYRPDVNEHEPEGMGDVQRFFLALRPRGGKNTRLMIVGRKRLPDAERHERNWGFVTLVSDDAAAIEEALREERYETKTRGEQDQPAARPAGEGVYVITREGSPETGQMHLAYELELPETPGPVQKAFKIAPKAAYALSVKNPEKASPAHAGLSREQQVDVPERLQEAFRDRRFESETPEPLNYEGAEIMLVGARTDPEKAYGIDLPAQDEDEAHADVFSKLRMAKSRHPIAPLIEGAWD
ncbi:MAG: hypothetical protein ACFE0R_20625 [Salinarimonas sp.]